VAPTQQGIFSSVFDAVKLFNGNPFRLGALLLVGLAFVVWRCAVPLAKIWQEDRKDKRRHEREMLKLTRDAEN
jgi:hypothetical protein